MSQAKSNAAAAAKAPAAKAGAAAAGAGAGAKTAAPGAVAAAPKKLVPVAKTADDFKDKPEAVSKLLAQWEAGEGTEAEWQKFVSENKAAVVDAVLMHFESAVMDVSVSGDVVHLMHVFAHLSGKLVAEMLLKSNIISKPLVDEPVKWSWQKLGSTVTYGPMSKEELKKEWETKKLTADNKVWHDAMKEWAPVKSLPSLVAYLSGAPSVRRRPTAAPAVTFVKVLDDQQLWVWRLQLLLQALNPAHALDLKTLVEVKEKTALMNDLLTHLPEHRPEIQALISQALFLLESIDPEAALLQTEAQQHPNASYFAKVLVVLFNSKDTSTLAPAAEFVDATVKRAAEAGDGKDLLFDTADVDQLITLLWRVVAATRDDQVFLQSVVTIQSIVRASPTVWPDVKFLTHLNELKARAYGLAQTKKNDELVVTLANEIMGDIATLLQDNAWLGKQRPPSPKIDKRKITAKDAKDSKTKAPTFKAVKKAAPAAAKKPEAKAAAPAAAAPAAAAAAAKLDIPFDKSDFDALMEANNAAEGDVLTLDTDKITEKLERFTKSMDAGAGTEEEWVKAVEANDFQLPTILGLILANVKSLSAGEQLSVVNNISILATINPEEVCAHLAVLRGFIAAYAAHIKAVARLPPAAAEAEMGNWKLDSEKTADELDKEKKAADAKAKYQREFDDAERGATIFEARLQFVLNVCLAAPDAAVETRVVGADAIFKAYLPFLVFEESALAMELAGATLIILNINDAAKTPLHAAANVKAETRQALMEASYKLINRAEHDAKAALTEEQRKKLEWAALVFVQQVVEHHPAYFYSNDVQVLVDSLMRKSLDTGVDVLLPEYLKTLGAICAWKGYPKDKEDDSKLYKADELLPFYDNLLSSVRSVVPPTELTEAVEQQIAALVSAWEERIGAAASS